MRSIFRAVFEPKHGTAERWSVCDCKECLAALGVVACTAPALPACEGLGLLTHCRHRREGCLGCGPTGNDCEHGERCACAVTGSDPPP